MTKRSVVVLPVVVAVLSVLLGDSREPSISIGAMATVSVRLEAMQAREAPWPPSPRREPSRLARVSAPPIRLVAEEERDPERRHAADLTPPVGGNVIDGAGADIDTQASSTTLLANGMGADDPESGIVLHEWAIGTTPGGEDVQAFTSAGLTVTPVPVWTRNYNGAANQNDAGIDLAIDSAGVVYVAGQDGTSPLTNILQKWSPAGALLTTVSLNVNGTGGNGTCMVAVDGADNVYTAATIGSGDIWVRAHTPALAILWTDVFNTGGEDITGRHLGLDPGGFLLVPGAQWGSLWDRWLRRYPLAGPPASWTVVDGGDADNDMWFAAEADAAGNVYGAGNDKVGGSNQNIVVKKYSPAGALLWADVVDSGAGASADNAFAIAVGPAEVYAAGVLDTAGQDGNIWLRKYSLAGAVLWTRTVNGPASGLDYAMGVTVDRAGGVWVTGFVNVAGQGRNVWVAKYDSNGNLLWTDTFNGAANGNDQGSDVLIRGAALYVAGSETVAGQGTNLWLRKYDAYAWSAANAALALTGGVTYYATLRVTNGDGLQTIVSSDGVTVDDVTPPAIDLATGTPAAGTAPLTVDFAALASDVTGISLYQWDFDGDGIYDYTSGVGGNVSFQYGVPGFYLAGLRVFDGAGNSSTTSIGITVSSPAPPPTAFLTAAPTSGSVPLAVTFTAGGVAGVSSYQWDFDGDGHFDLVSTVPSVVHTYTVAGTFDPFVRLVYADGSVAFLYAPTVTPSLPPAVAGIAARIVRFFRDYNQNGAYDPGLPIEQLAFAAAGLGPQASFTGVSLGFTAEVDDASGIPPSYEIARWEWDFEGDGEFESESPAGVPSALRTENVHTYGAPGSCSVTVRCTWRLAGGGADQFSVQASMPLDLAAPSQANRRVWIVQPVSPIHVPGGGRVTPRIAGNYLLFNVNCVPASHFDFATVELQVWDPVGVAWVTLPGTYVASAGSAGQSARLRVNVEQMIADGFNGIVAGATRDFRARAVTVDVSWVPSATDAGPGTDQGNLQGPMKYGLVTIAGGPTAADLVQTSFSPERATARVSGSATCTTTLTTGSEFALPYGGIAGADTLTVADEAVGPPANG